MPNSSLQETQNISTNGRTGSLQQLIIMYPKRTVWGFARVYFTSPHSLVLWWQKRSVLVLVQVLPRNCHHYSGNSASRLLNMAQMRVLKLKVISVLISGWCLNCDCGSFLRVSLSSVLEIQLLDSKVQFPEAYFRHLVSLETKKL